MTLLANPTVSKMLDGGCARNDSRIFGSLEYTDGTATIGSVKLVALDGSSARRIRARRGRCDDPCFRRQTEHLDWKMLS